MNFNWLVLPTLAGALLLFVMGQRSLRCCRTFRQKLALSLLWLVLALPGILLPLYYLHWFDDALWFYEFRSFPYSELTAMVAGLFAGAVAELTRGRKLISRGFLIVLLVLGIVAPHLKPILAPLASQRFSESWNEDVCLQSTPSSCGAASAATLFRRFGGSLSEQDLARECFTYRGGTENWYIARAFRKRGYKVRYRMGEGLPADLRTPAIAGVRVDGLGHFIAILEDSGDAFVTGDPLVGRKVVDKDEMDRKFDFTGFFMEIESRGE